MEPLQSGRGFFIVLPKAIAPLYLRIMAIVEIKQVLQNWDYPTALQLYKQSGGNSFLIGLFEAGENTYNNIKLRSELEDILSDDARPAPGPGPTLQSGTDQPPSTSDFNQLPFQEQALISKRLSVFHAAHEQFHKLHHLNEEARRKAALQILDDWDEIEDLRRQQENFQETGQLPGEELKVEVNTEDNTTQLIKRRNTLRTYISKAKAGKKPVKHIPKWEAEILEIERKLNI